MSLIYKNASELVELLQAGTVTSVEVTQAFLDRIEEDNGVVNSFLHVSADSALETAADVDRRRAAGENAGSKLAKAEELAIEVINETTFRERIGA